MDEIYIFARSLSQREVKKYVGSIEDVDLEDAYSPTSPWDATFDAPLEETLPTSEPSVKRKATHPAKPTTFPTARPTKATTKKTTERTTAKPVTTPQVTTTTTKKITKETTEKQATTPKTTPTTRTTTKPRVLQNTTTGKPTKLVSAAATKATHEDTQVKTKPTHLPPTTTKAPHGDTEVKTMATTKPTLPPIRITTKATQRATTKKAKQAAAPAVETAVLTHGDLKAKKEICELGNVYRNSDLVGGLGSGNFTDKGKVANIEECMSLCCLTDKCTVAYMVELSCFAVRCHNKTLCETFRKSPLESSAVIGFVQRYQTEDAIPITVAPTKPALYVRPAGVPTVLIDELAATTPAKPPAHRSRHKSPAKTCGYSRVHRHVTLKGGLRAGKITRVADFSTMEECARKCCGIVSCDAALLMKRTCFALHCSSEELCETRPSTLKNFSLMIQYVKRQSTQDDSLHNINKVIFPTDYPTSPTGSTGSTSPTSLTSPTFPTEPSLQELLGLAKPTPSPAVDSQIEKILTPDASKGTCAKGLSVHNVILSAGMGAGEVTQFPNLKRMPLCIEKCCSLAQCHVAYIIHEVCYTVNCFSRDLCRTRPLEGADVTSEINYVRRDGLTMFSLAEEASVASEGLATQATQTSSASERTLANRTAQPTESNERCQAQSPLDHVRLVGDLNAGVFTDRGLVSSVDQCSASCCASGSCDLAYVVNQRCYSVTCYSVELCQAVSVRPMAFNPTIVYVTRDDSDDSDALRNGDGASSVIRPTPTAAAVTTTQTTATTTPTTGTTTSPTTRTPTTNSTTKAAPTHAPTSSGTTKPKNPEHHGNRDSHALKHHKSHSHEHHVTTASEHKDEACPAEKFGCQHYCARIADGGYRCMCRRGFKLQWDGRRCEAHEECADGTHGCEHRCARVDGVAKCECDSGYMLNVDKKHCDDLDECLLGIHACSQRCHNTPGSYRCTCEEGYRLSPNRMTCEGLVERGSKKDRTRPLKPDLENFEVPTVIIQSPKDIHIVQGKPAIFHCKARGHPPPHIAWASGTNGDRPIPSDDRFDILPSGSLAIRRVNVTDRGFYRCVASNPAGSSAAGASLKVRDLDECAARRSDCAQLCVNTPGSFRCGCRRGFLLHEDGRSCQDVDECSSRAHACDQRCTNTPGSYRCSCRTGYNLIPDNKTCIDIDECTHAQHGCSQLCDNTAGSYYCACLKGYILNKDNRTCIAKPADFTLRRAAAVSAGVGAFIGLVGLSLVIIIGAIVCVIRLRRLARVKNGAVEEGERKSLFSWLE